MQTPKQRSVSLEVPQRTSPVTPRTSRQRKPAGSDSDSSHPASRTSKDRSPKIIERRSPRSPVTEKRRPSRVSELESQVSQLQDDLKKAKHQLSSSESWKRQVQQEADEAKKQLFATSAKLEESQHQLIELSASEEARLHELQKISKDRDRAWQSELEAIQNQHSIDSAALSSAMNEIQKLRYQLGLKAEKTKHAESKEAEVQSLLQELQETVSMVEKMKTQIAECKESEDRALELVSRTQLQLEEAKITAENFRLDRLKAMEAYDSLALELEQSKAEVTSLEGLVSKLRGDMKFSRENGDVDEVEQLKTELKYMRAALEASEIRYQEEYIQSTLQIRTAYEQMEKTKSESYRREAELEAELKRAKTIIEELKTKLVDEETELKSIGEENQGSERGSELEMELKRLEADITNLKANLLDREAELKGKAEENEMLKLEIKVGQLERAKATDEAVALAEASRVAEQEALRKLGYVTDEADKSNRRAARVAEQLDAVQVANSEMEAEMRRLKVQSDQWRKAAEAAAAMIQVNNGKFVERTGSHDNSYNTLGEKMGSPYSEETDDDSPKKKAGNMLKKIGVLWKKGQK